MTIKLLIVDDSALMRRQLTQLFQAERDFTVQVARNGREAIEENMRFEPDVITLDINMPEMDGITSLSHIMSTRPTPVVMLSSLTERGAMSTFEALALGAVDYVAKPGGTISLSIEDIAYELVSKVRNASRVKIKPKRKQNFEQASRTSQHKKAVPAVSRPSLTRKGNIVIVGVSTGGPGTLEEILLALDPNFPVPIVIAQHMPASFTGPFSARLNKLLPFTVLEVSKPMEIMPGHVYIGRGGADVLVGKRMSKHVVMPKPQSEKHLWHPSVELLGRSAIEHFEPKNITAVMLTGMGNDGADAFKEIHSLGGKTIAESEQSSVVFGMPKELIEREGATRILNSSQIANQLERWVR